MSSVSEIITKAFRKQVLNQLKESMENDGEKYDLTYLERDKKRGYIDMWFEEDEDTLNIRHFCYSGKSNVICQIDDFYSKRNAELELIAIEITRLIKQYNTAESFCDCNKPLNFVSDLLKMNTNRHKFLTNFCVKCGSNHLSRLNTLVNKGFDLDNHTCNICETKCLEKIDDEDLKYTELINITCCKNKVICFSCKDKCENKCPFCRQELKWRY